MQVVKIRGISVKRIGEVKIYHYRITYKSDLGRKHEVKVSVLKCNGFKGLIVNNELLKHSDLIEYLTNTANITTITPKEASELIVKFNFS